MYGGESETAVCPGEANCEKFAGAKGSSRKARERNACYGCSLFQTKTDGGQVAHRAFERLVNRAFYARTRKRSGYPLGLKEIDNMVFEVVLLLEDVIEGHEILQKRQATDTILAAAGIKRG